jgi:hypothetical protein
MTSGVVWSDVQVEELKGELSRLRDERTELESELDTQTTETHKHVLSHLHTYCILRSVSYPRN